MRTPALGVVFLPSSGVDAVDLIVRAERAGVGTAWLEMDAVGLDPLPLLAAAAIKTDRIGLGTAILSVFSRHPAALANEAMTVEALSPGRLRLGIGAGNTARMAEAFRCPTDRPLSNARLPHATSTPVLLSALGPMAFDTAGEMADGALSWLCPIDHLLDIGLPAMTRGAAMGGRPRPPLIGHVPVAIVSRESGAEMRDAVRHEISRYARVPVFARMLTQAGYPTADGVVSDALLDELVVIGDEAEVTARLTSILGRGIDELMISLIPDSHRRDHEDMLFEILGAIGSAGPSS